MRKRGRRTRLDLSLAFIARAQELTPETQKQLLETMKVHESHPRQREFWLVLPSGGKVRL